MAIVFKLFTQAFFSPLAIRAVSASRIVGLDYPCQAMPRVEHLSANIEPIYHCEGLCRKIISSINSISAANLFMNPRFEDQVMKCGLGLRLTSTNIPLREIILNFFQMLNAYIAIFKGLDSHKFLEGFASVSSSVLFIS